MNKVVLIGNMVKDAELKFANGGMAITKFTVAVSRGYKDKQETDFINCVAFNKLAESIAQYTAKGSKVAIEGSIRVGKYTDKEGNNRYSTEIFCNSVEFLSKVNTNTQEYQPNQEVQNVVDTLNEPINPFDNKNSIGELGEIGGIFNIPIDNGDSPF